MSGDQASPIMKVLATCTSYFIVLISTLALELGLHESLPFATTMIQLYKIIVDLRTQALNVVS